MWETIRFETDADEETVDCYRTSRRNSFFALTEEFKRFRGGSALPRVVLGNGAVRRSRLRVFLLAKLCY
ncbi:hypothetical protein EA472_15045 [Natrarchaeobius oligotrophus]|uniref:Uncharacterized protein n=1 Tax=Natrarchaeobius chitinivorans TaxID=1679083 RepID=A0A3N6MEC1_NATCH|nr:hypothetical protein EA472_15045 [Natrarchaeobius chitinivorans]